MSCGRPVVAGANENSELFNVINDSGCGITVKPENTDEMFDAIIKLYKK